MQIMKTVLGLVLLTGLAAAQSQDQQEKLDILFGNLRNTNSRAVIIQTEAQIWQIWMQSGTSADNLDLNDASIAMNTGNFRYAESKLTTLIASTPTFPEAFNKRATLYFMMERYEESLADIKKTLELEPRHFGALSGRGMVFQRINKPRDALKAFREAIAVNPHLSDAKQAIKALEQLEPDL